MGTIHHEFTFTEQEGLDAIPDVIYHLETYAVTTVRASTPMYLLSRKIKAMGVKMVLSGEGSDEILGGNVVLSVAHANARMTVFQDTCTSMPLRMLLPSTRRLFAASRTYTPPIASALTS